MSWSILLRVVEKQTAKVLIRLCQESRYIVTANMSGGDGRQLSNHDIQLVQKRIEQCLLLYMSKKEVINALAIQDNIDPHFIELVWQRLEEENQEFFKAYDIKLLVKDQIMEFNRLLSEQVELMRRLGLCGIPRVLSSNGLHVPPIQHISTSSAMQNARPLKTEDVQQGNMFTGCGSIMQQSCTPGTINESVQSRRINVSPNVYLSQDPNVELARTMNGKVVKTEAGFAGSLPFAFSPPGNYLESRALLGDASVSSFSSVDSNAQHLNGTILDGEACSFGFLEQIPHSFNLPELAADFTTSPDFLESYCRTPFLAADANDLVDPHGDVEKTWAESESLRFQCFGDE